jgi:cysteinyl-tRNA synthetase
MKLFNTMSRSIEELKPLNANKIALYSCGPTVYDHAHIGNLSTYVFADTLRRTLQLAGHEVKHVMNYTDVDDKTIRRSRETYPNEEPRKRLKKLTDNYIEIFRKDMQAAGNNLEAITFVRATDEKVMEGMKQLITDLHAGGFAYTTDDGVYFSIEAYRKSGKKYGQLLELTAQNTSAERIQNDEYDKESAHDFALWKKQKAGEPAWEFTLDGHDMTGRPGWHIECSVMSRQNLDQPFDIHTGAIDLIFPHHENEIAQSTALETNPTMARFFVHNGHLLVDGKKMAKSANNFYTLEQIAEESGEDGSLAFRLLVLQSHYRTSANYTRESLQVASSRLNDLRKFAQLYYQPNLIGKHGLVTQETIADIKQDLLEMLKDDLDTPRFLNRLDVIRHHIRNERLKDAAAFEAFKDLIEFIDQSLGLNLLVQKGLDDEQLELIQQAVEHEDKLWKEIRTKDGSQAEYIEVDRLKKELRAKYKVSVSNDPEYAPLWSRL